jgi:peptidoglycan/LPS O-acetylase OafA/YrhL
MSTTQSRRGTATSSVPVKKNTLRTDIQGLRALAVLAVVFDHLFAWPSGGFVGVDVFFVISGFLITGLLLREHDRTGTISFRGFYLRRVKRIIPAAMLVIVATIVTAYLVFSSVRASQTLWDGVWATFFAANWHSALQGTDYFNAAFAASPLQHYWSLSVEEQFYFVWPWVMLLIFVIAARTRSGNGQRAAHRAITVVIVVITAASFGWGLYDTATNASWAYFSTFTRAWELGVGALLAVIGTAFARIPSALRPVLGWTGLIGMIASLFIVNDNAGGFPAPWAALPVLATALVIAAGTGGEQRWMWPITNRVSSWVGDISYSLYLWHFPVIIILAALMPEDLTYYAACILLMMLLAVGSFYLVEEPIRRFKKGNLRAASKRSRERGGASGRQLVGVSVLAVAAIVLSAWALTPVRISTDAGQVPLPHQDRLLQPKQQNPGSNCRAKFAPLSLPTRGRRSTRRLISSTRPLPRPSGQQTRAWMSRLKSWSAARMAPKTP